MPHPGPQEDLLLVHRILDGSLEAWHEFIERYTGLLNHTIRRVLRDRDDIATVYVGMLERLYRGQLSKYRGESRLGTWLVFVARSAALDHARRLHGRRRRPSADVPARGVALQTERLLEYLAQQRAEGEERMWAHNPETLRLEREALAASHRVRAVVEALPPTEREVLALRFEQGLSAREIAGHLGLSSPRRAFTILDAAIRHVRRALQLETEEDTRRMTGSIT